MPVTLPALLKRLQGVQRSGDGYVAFCPAHEDRTHRSLSVTEKNGKILLHCFAGCQPEKVAAVLHLRLADLFIEAGNGRRPAREPVAIYDYVDEAGTLLYQVVRFDPKDFRPRRPDGRGGWIKNLEETRRVVYRLPDLAEATRAYFVEGEKDADRLWSLGLPATTTQGGAKSWTPHADRYAQQLRDVGLEELVILPDNDAPGGTYATGVARTATAAGLRVKLLPLPALPPKGDVSDWLDAGHTAGELVSLVEAASMFQPSGSQEATPGAAEPTLTRDGDAVVLTWLADALTVTASNFHDGSDGASAEVLIQAAGRDLHWARLGLASTQARVTLTKKLREQAPDVDWAGRLERVCRLAADTWRAGEPVVALVPRVHDVTERYALAPIQPRGQSALVYIHGGGGKSLLGTLAGICTVTGRPVAGLRPQVTGPVLFLDWESTQDEHETRLALLATGLGLDPGALLEKLYYRPMAGRLADEARRLRQDVARLGVVLVVVDSVVPAAGPEAEGSEAAVRLMGTLRSLGNHVSRLLLGHVSKGDATQGGPTSPFGSVFYWNLSRSVWEVRADDDDREHLRVSLTHKKVNAGPRLPTFGLDFHFQPDRITVAPLDLADEPTLTRSASQSERALLALRGGPLTTKALAEVLDTTDAIASAVGRRLASRGRVVRLSRAAPEADGSTFRWALATSRDPKPAT